MMQTLLWTLSAVGLVACGWFASAWYYKRKISALQKKVKAVRHAASEQADQARRQIAQLQLDLAARPPLERHVAPQAPKPAVPAAPNVDHLFDDDEVRVINDGFAATRIDDQEPYEKTMILTPRGASAR